jgi:hypothetical protein
MAIFRGPIKKREIPARWNLPRPHEQEFAPPPPKKNPPPPRNMPWVQEKKK